jgi:hypothetical protein
MSQPTRFDYVNAFATLMLSDHIGYGKSSSLTTFHNGPSRTHVLLLSTAPQLQFITDKQLRKIVELSLASNIPLSDFLANLRHKTSSVQVREMEGFWVQAPTGLLYGKIYTTPTYSFYGGIDYDGSVNS